MGDRDRDRVRAPGGARATGSPSARATARRCASSRSTTISTSRPSCATRGLSGLGLSAARGAIAAGHPVTAEVGAEVLRAGGSAVDACVAAAFASWVAEPALTGPGGGGFLVAYDAARRPAARPRLLRGRARARATAAPVAPLEPYVVDFGTGQQTFLVGPGSCAVPGVTAGLEARAPPARPPALGRARATRHRARARGRRADAGARRRDRAAQGLPRRLAGGRARVRPVRRRRCGPASARATRRSPTRSSASPPTARASSPTARPRTRWSPTRPRPGAA